MSKSISEWRRRQYAKIEYAKTELGLSDDDYRGLLRQEFKVGSKTELDDRGVARLLAHFLQRGWKPKQSRNPRNPDGLNAQQRLVLALWSDLGIAGKIDNPTPQALNAWIARHTRIRTLKWLNDAALSNVIEALKQWLAR